MIRQNRIPLDCPAEWKGALGGIKHAFGHTWESCFAMQLTTGFKTYLYCFEAERVRIICPIAERNLEQHIDVVTPYGFSGFVGNGDVAEFPSHWKTFAKKKRYVCGFIGLNPLFDNRNYYDTGELYEYNAVYALDLTLPESELLANLSENRKRQLKNWDHFCANLVFDKSLLKQFLLAHFVDFFRRKNASATYNLSSETLSFLIDLENVFAVGIASAGRVEAVSVFAYTPHVGEYLFNVSIPGKQDYSAALLWYGIKHLKSLAVPFINLGGGVRKGDGIAKFKERFGGISLPLNCLKQVYDAEIFADLCERVNANPTERSGYFPPYRCVSSSLDTISTSSS